MTRITPFRSIAALGLTLVVILAPYVGAESAEQEREGLFVEADAHQDIALSNVSLNEEHGVDLKYSTSQNTEAPDLELPADTVVAAYRNSPTNSTVAITKQDTGGYKIDVTPVDRNVTVWNYGPHQNGTVKPSHHQEFEGNSKNHSRYTVEDAHMLYNGTTGLVGLEPWHLPFLLIYEGVEVAPDATYRVATRQAGVALLISSDLETAPLAAPPSPSEGDSDRMHGHEPILPPPAKLEPDLPDFTTSTIADALPPVVVGGDSKDENFNVHTTSSFPPDRAQLSIAVAAIATTIGVFLFLALYSLFQSKDVLRNKVRQRILKEIEARPGITVAELADATGVTHQTVSYHLQFLKKSGYTTDHQEGNRRRHFAANQGFTKEKRLLFAVAEDPLSMRVLELIENAPWIIKKEIATTLGLTRTAASWHVTKLARVDLVHLQREQGFCFLFVNREKVKQLRALLNTTPAEPGQEPIATADARMGLTGHSAPT